VGNFETFPDLPGVFRGVERRVSALERPAHAQRRTLVEEFDPAGYHTVTAASPFVPPDVIGEVLLDIPEGGACAVFMMAGLSVASTGSVVAGVRFGEDDASIAFDICRSSLVSADPNAGELRLSVPGSTSGVNGFGGGAVIYPASGLIPVQVVAWNESSGNGRLQFIYLWAWAV
jgi:hypothetical protein